MRTAKECFKLNLNSDFPSNPFHFEWNTQMEWREMVIKLPWLEPIGLVKTITQGTWVAQ